MDTNENQNFLENDDHLLTDEHESSEYALTLKFPFGFNSNLEGGVHNLTNKEKKEVFYSSAHTGVIYNYETGDQILLQGHVIFDQVSVIKSLLLVLVWMMIRKEW